MLRLRLIPNAPGQTAALPSSSSWPTRCPLRQAIPEPLPSNPPVRLAEGGGEPPDCSKIKAAGPPSPKTAAHRPMVGGSLSRASAVAEAVQSWAKSHRACQCYRSRSRGVGARIIRLRFSPLLWFSSCRTCWPDHPTYSRPLNLRNDYTNFVSWLHFGHIPVKTSPYAGCNPTETGSTQPAMLSTPNDTDTRAETATHCPYCAPVRDGTHRDAGRGHR